MFNFIFEISVEEFEFYNQVRWNQEFNKTLEVFKAIPKSCGFRISDFSALLPDGHSIKLVL